MDNKEPKNCWEFHNCPEESKKKCPAFPSDGRDCWVVASSHEGVGCHKTSGMGMKFCMSSCGWFKKLNPGSNK